VPQRETRQSNTENIITAQHLIHQFINMAQCKVSRRIANAHTAVVTQERLQVLMDVNSSANEAQIQSSKETEVFKIVILDKLYNNLFIGLYLKHLEQQADEICWFLRLAKHPAHAPQFHAFINYALC